MCFHGNVLKTNRAGEMLEDQDIKRIPIFTLKQFRLPKSIWSKIIVLHAPSLEDTSAEKQDEIDDILQVGKSND